jgi:ornithine decarboxylase
LLLQTLVNYGIGFDVASAGEINTCLGYGVEGSHMIFANPCKYPGHLRFARDHKVDLMTFDNLAELEKIKLHFPNARLVLRILTDDSKSICKFGTKFGTPPHHIPVLLAKCRELDLNLVGVSFHVGSGCLDTEPFVDAIRQARLVFDQAQALGLPPLTILDLGGGWPGAKETDPYPSFPMIAARVRQALDSYFPEESNPELDVIAEPGRYFAAESHNLATNVYARRDTSALEPFRQLAAQDAAYEAEQHLSATDYLYYITDGVYSSFNCLVYDHAAVTPRLLRGAADTRLYHSTMFGPTCDSFDCIAKDILLPKLEVGDWIYFEDMGAYTVSAAADFNGFGVTPTFTVDSSL